MGQALTSLFITYSLLLFKFEFSYAKSSCENLETPAGKMSLLNNGSVIKIDGQLLDLKTASYSVISGTSAISPGIDNA